ncbi:Inactive pancreatic lipase-related protein 1 [Exaiptasia diaphana]|nr:Inactive pancreatic lipase-related protein 1 [Exaiptasia diaphana]
MSLGMKVCYTKYGCFSDDPPFDNVMMSLPNNPQNIATEFLFYAPNTTNLPQKIRGGLDSSLKIIIIIHGFLQSGRVPWVQELREELMRKEKMNVIVVNWERGSSALGTYNAAAGNTRLVGSQLAELLLRHDYDMSRVHVIGHSLGAHVAGFAGEQVRKAGKTIRRITGLDPARPGFDHDEAVGRLDPSDADFVDVIHTDSGRNLLEGGLGLHRPCGHVDIYPNGGQSQPGCDFVDNLNGVLDKISILRGEFPLPWVFACDHMKAISYLISSINNNCSRLAFPCKDWISFTKGKCFNCKGACAEMGYNADESAVQRNSSQKFYLSVDSKKPYCAPLNYLSVTLHDLRFGNGLLDSLTRKKIIIRLTTRNGSKMSTDYSYVEDNVSELSRLIVSDITTESLTSISILFYGRTMYVGRVTVQGPGYNYTACYDTWMHSFFYFWEYTKTLHRGDHTCPD